MVAHGGSGAGGTDGDPLYTVHYARSLRQCAGADASPHPFVRLDWNADLDERAREKLRGPDLAAENPMNSREALRSDVARKERRTSLLLGAAVVFALSAGEPLYRNFDGPLFAVRVIWCVMWVAVAWALPRATTGLYGFLLPLASVCACWLFATTVWLNGGVRGPDYQYMVMFPLALMVLFQDEVAACSGGVVGTLSAVAALSWLGDAPIAAAVDNLMTDAAVGVLAVFGSFSFRRVRIAEFNTQQARATALEQLALSEHRRAQSERLASLGQLAAGVAHEINNPLFYVSGNVDSLALENGLTCPGLSSAEIHEMLADAQQGIRLIAQIVGDLKEFSSGGSDSLEPCQVDTVIGDTLRLASIKLGPNVEVRRSCEPHLPSVTVSRRKLSQVLLNLLVNSAEAMDEAHTQHPWVLIAAQRVGNAVQIAVQDNGPGISTKVASRLFEPYATSKPVGKGTGLGLALSREYVMAFGGQLELQPIVGPGARFSILLPISPEELSAVGQ
jgi:signal transduction histidine kinase